MEFNPLLPKLPHFQNGKMGPREGGVTRFSGSLPCCPCWGTVIRCEGARLSSV